MTGFEPGSSGIGSDHAANCATTTAQHKVILKFTSWNEWHNPMKCDVLFKHSNWLHNQPIRVVIFIYTIGPYKHSIFAKILIPGPLENFR